MCAGNRRYFCRKPQETSELRRVPLDSSLGKSRLRRQQSLLPGLGLLSEFSLAGKKLAKLVAHLSSQIHLKSQMHLMGHQYPTSTAKLWNDEHLAYLRIFIMRKHCHKKLREARECFPNQLLSELRKRMRKRKISGGGGSTIHPRYIWEL